MLVQTYHKIQSLYKRDNRGKFTDEFAEPWISRAYQNNELFVGYEKIDGTNIRVCYDGTLDFRGRTDKTQTPQFLIDALEAMWQPKVEQLKEMFDYTPLIFVGEGFGERIQKGGGNYGPPSFIGFDIINEESGLYVPKEFALSVFQQLGIPTVPKVGDHTLETWESIVAPGIVSNFGDFESEGVVVIPKIESYQYEYGETVNPKLFRRILKLKTKDYC